MFKINNTLSIKLSFIFMLFSLPNYFVPALANEIEPVHYAYSNYLGSGIYRTSGQNVTLINLPFSYEIGQEGQTTYGLRLPVSLGFFDFSFDDVPDLDFPSSVGTFTFTPGIEFAYRVNENLVLESYIDIGYAKNLTTNRDVTVHSAGLSSLYYFDIKNYDSIWSSRIYYAGYNGHSYDASDSYAAIQLGIDIGLPVHYKLLGYRFQPRIFTSLFWYFNDVDFKLPVKTFSEKEQEVTLTNSTEVGVTLKFDETIGYSWAGIDRIGISYRYSNNINVIRLLFSFPI
ncbi:MAG: hypothetical protein MJK12_02950 [Colwellia sp.]|nr:hypothetical protein [Colwellia sp.]